MIDLYLIKDKIYDNELYMYKLENCLVKEGDFMKALSLYLSNLKQFNPEQYELIKERLNDIKTV